jgi:hypothetical protein
MQRSKVGQSDFERASQRPGQPRARSYRVRWSFLFTNGEASFRILASSFVFDGTF